MKYATMIQQHIKKEGGETTMTDVILTGDRPTGSLHLGHYVGSLANRVALQGQCRQYIIIADMQALTDNAPRAKEIANNIVEVVLDYLSVGIDPNLSTIFIQSQIPALSELTMYYLNLVSVARLQRNPTVKSEIDEKKFAGGVPTGFFIYPVSQAADITAFKATLIPVGQDQLPMIEQTNEIVRRFNSLYHCAVLREVKPLLGHFPRLPGIGGGTKMSKSLGNAIFLSDAPDIVRAKVLSMFTDPKHLRAEDPGTVEGNPVFAYLDAFDPDKIHLEEMKERYQRGGLGDVKVKQHLLEVLETFLVPIRQRRKEAEKDREEVHRILQKGTKEAREIAAQTLLEVKEAMGFAH